MTLADLATIGKTLGIPGVMILVWYLLEKQRGERQAVSDTQRATAENKLQEQRIAAENKKTEAMEEGFRSLANMVAEHAQADTAAHGEMGERLAAIETQLDMRKTPARGVPVLRETVRRTDGR